MRLEHCGVTGGFLRFLRKEGIVIAYSLCGAHGVDGAQRTICIGQFSPHTVTVLVDLRLGGRCLYLPNHFTSFICETFYKEL